MDTSTASPSGTTDPVARVQRVASSVARAAAPSVDKEARFPAETFAALKEERLLGAAIPKEHGGLGCAFTEIVAMCQALGQACPSSAAIFSMHAIQVASMARHHGGVTFFKDYLAECADKQLLVASGTSEVGVGGDMRSSIAAVERTTAGRFRFQKNCSVLSYGEHADAVLITGRRTPDSAASDQVCILIRKGDYALEKVGVWDTLGMRGTCSPPFKVTAEAAEDQILPHSFAQVANDTMVPYSHIVWSAGWLGLASDAVALARGYLRQDARKRPGTMPFGSTRLVEAVNNLQLMRANVMDAAREYERLMDSPEGPEHFSSVGYILKINNLKLASSQLAAAITQQCLGVCGVMAYSNASKFSLGRHLRDALGAALMIANDRITNTNASLLLVHKDD